MPRALEPKPKPPSVPPPAALMQSGGAEPAALVQSEAEPMPAWASLDPDPRAWWELFDEYGMDTTSRQALFALAQSDAAAASHVIFKLVKKKADGVELGNPSAFLHTLCKKASHAESDAKRARSDTWSSW